VESFGYCWFSGQNVISVAGGTLIGLLHHTVGSEVATVCLEFHKDGKLVGRHSLTEEMPIDDHNSPSLIALNDNEFLLGYTGHDTDNVLRVVKFQLLSESFEEISNLRITMPTVTTYVYFALIVDSRLLIITRSINWRPTGLWVDLQNSNFSDPFVLFEEQGVNDQWLSIRDGLRPYLRIQRAHDRTYFAITDSHPRNYRNGVYSGYFIGSEIYSLDNEQVGKIGGTNPVAINMLTCLVPPGQSDISWIQDIRAYGDKVVVAFSTSKRDDLNFRSPVEVSAESYSYKLVSHERGRIKYSEVSPAGPALYEMESDYVGGISLHPTDSNLVAISTAINPITRMTNLEGIQRLYLAELIDQVWHFRMLESQNLKSSIRPIFSNISGETHYLFYLSGNYSTFKSYEMLLCSIPFTRFESCFELSTGHVDIPWIVKRENTTMESAIVERISREMEKANNYLEWGGGVSTLLAFDCMIPNITTIDTDPQLIRILKEHHHHQEINFKTINPISSNYVLKEWGYIDSAIGTKNQGIEYATAFLPNQEIDLVLIDGRYRSLCFLMIISNQTKPLSVLFDDYLDRPWYGMIEKYIKPVEFVGRMAIFVLEQPIQVAAEDIWLAAADMR